MKSAPLTSQRDRILGGLWGSLIGDALGVPVEFQSRAERMCTPPSGQRQITAV
jgi:hypothetical protein